MAKTATTDTELAGRLHASALHLLRRLAQEDRSTGVTPARLSTLSVLVFGGPRTIGALARAEGVTPPTMTRLVAALVADGLVDRQPDPDDRRVVRVAATDRGRAILLTGRDRRVSTLTTMLAPLTPKERRRIEAASAIIERMLEPGPRAGGGA